MEPRGRLDTTGGVDMDHQGKKMMKHNTDTTQRTNKAKNWFFGKNEHSCHLRRQSGISEYSWGCASPTTQPSHPRHCPEAAPDRVCGGHAQESHCIDVCYRKPWKQPLPLSCRSKNIAHSRKKRYPAERRASLQLHTTM